MSYKLKSDNPPNQQLGSVVDANITTNTGHVPIQSWGLDPTFSSFRKMLIAAIREEVTIEEWNGVFLFKHFGRGILKVEIVGIITSVNIRNNKVVYHVHDGTSSDMRCTKYINTNNIGADSSGLHFALRLGDLVSCRGTLVRSETNEEAYGFAITITMIDVLKDPNSEIDHWLNSIILHRHHYSQSLNS